MQCLVDAGLIGAERATTLEHENDLPPLGGLLLGLTAAHGPCARDLQHVFLLGCAWRWRSLYLVTVFGVVLYRRAATALHIPPSTTARTICSRR